MRERLEDADPSLLKRIRQLAKEGFDRSGICSQLRSDGRHIELVRVRQIIHRCHVAVVPHQRDATPLALAAAKETLAREIADHKAHPVDTAYKTGKVWRDWRDWAEAK